jgi:hypothetical protein
MAALTKLIPGILAAVAVVGLSGCSLRAKTKTATAVPPKPAAPAPANVPLSTPQTQVELPKPQPIDPAAWNTEPIAAAPVEPPVAPRPPAPLPKRTVRTEVPAPAVTPPPEPPRPEFQEIIPEADQKRYQASAQNRKREIARIIEQLNKRHLTKSQQNDLAAIMTFVAQSDESEKKNEMKMADVLAERAQILAKSLQNGR